MSYCVRLRAAAIRDLRRLPRGLRDRIHRQLARLETDPRPAGIQKLVGRVGSWRIRSGDYRILLEIDDSARAITVFRIAHRREVYRA